MRQLNISFKFFSLFVHHTDGLSVLLPLGGHTAEMEGELVGKESLSGVMVDLIVEDAAGKCVTVGTSQATLGRLRDVRIQDPSAAATIDNVRTHLSGALQSGISSRLNLTDGVLSDPYDFKKAVFSGALWRIGANAGHKLTDTVDYALPLDPAMSYTLRFTGTVTKDYNVDPSKTHDLRVTNGDAGVNEADCPKAPYADPFFLDEFSQLFAAVGVTVGVPMTPMPAHLAQLHAELRAAREAFSAAADRFNKAQSGIVHTAAFGAAGPVPETICRPCPDGCIVLD